MRFDGFSVSCCKGPNIVATHTHAEFQPGALATQAVEEERLGISIHNFAPAHSTEEVHGHILRDFRGDRASDVERPPATAAVQCFPRKCFLLRVVEMFYVENPMCFYEVLIRAVGLVVCASFLSFDLTPSVHLVVVVVAP